MMVKGSFHQKKIILNVWAFNKVTSKYIKKNLTEL